MTRPPIFHRRPQGRWPREPSEPRSPWRLDPDTVGQIVIVVVIMGVVFFAFWLGGCTPAHTAADERDENVCFAKAQLAHQARIAEQCEKPPFAECPAHDALMAQLEQEARKCQRP